MKSQLSFTHEVTCDVDKVRILVNDFKLFGSYHPLFEKVEQIAPHHYRISEFKPLILGLKFRFSYEAFVHIESGRTLYTAKAMGIDFHFEFKFLPGGQSRSQVQETVSLIGPAIFLPAVKKAISSCHPLIFKEYGAVQQKLP